MDKIKLIVNEDQYNDVLARLQIGARYIESDVFKHLPLAKQLQAKKRYDQLEYQILKYKGMI